MQSHHPRFPALQMPTVPGGARALPAPGERDTLLPAAGQKHGRREELSARLVIYSNQKSPCLLRNPAFPPRWSRADVRTWLRAVGGGGGSCRFGGEGRTGQRGASASKVPWVFIPKPLPHAAAPRGRGRWLGQG